MVGVVKKIARPYAKAAFALAVHADQLEAWNAFLNCAVLLVTDEGMKRVLHDPNISPDQILEVFLAVLEDDMQEERYQHFLRLLAEHRRFDALPAIALLFKAFRDAYEQTANVEVVSAFKVSSDQMKRLEAALKKRLNKKQVVLQCVIDPSLLGGAIIRSGDLMIDGSGRGKLRRLKEYLQVL